jgi:hypothetical protein
MYKNLYNLPVLDFAIYFRSNRIWSSSELSGYLGYAYSQQFFDFQESRVGVPEPKDRKEAFVLKPVRAF